MERATELVLLDDYHPEEKIAHIMRRPEYYAEIVLYIRRHLTQKQSYAIRLQELIELVKT